MIENKVYLDPRAVEFIKEKGIDLHRISKKWPDHCSLVQSIDRAIEKEYVELEQDFLKIEVISAWLNGSAKLFTSFSACDAGFFRGDEPLLKYDKKHHAWFLQSISFDVAHVPLQDASRTAVVLFGFTLQTLLWQAKKSKCADVSEVVGRKLEIMNVGDYLARFKKSKKNESSTKSNGVEVVFRTDTKSLGSEEDLKLRHEIETCLDKFLQARDLGEVDGGSIGGGTMEVFCTVNVPLKECKQLVTAFLEESGFPKAVTIRRA